MTIGAALLLIAVGAILRFAVNTVTVWGIQLHTIGDILMIVGLVGLVLWLVIWAPWARARRTTVVQRPPVDERPPDGYILGPDGRYHPADYNGEYPPQEYPPPADPRYPSGRRGRW